MIELRERRHESDFKQMNSRPKYSLAHRLAVFTGITPYHKDSNKFLKLRMLVLHDNIWKKGDYGS